MKGQVLVDKIMLAKGYVFGKIEKCFQKAISNKDIEQSYRNMDQCVEDFHTEKGKAIKEHLEKLVSITKKDY